MRAYNNFLGSRSSWIVVFGVWCFLMWGCAEPLPEPDTVTRVGLSQPDSPLLTIRVAFRSGSANDPV